MYYANDKKLPLDRAFTLDEISYPSNWLRLATAEDKEAVGIEHRDDPVLTFKNEKFYYNTVQDGVVTSTPKDLDGLKRRMTGDANRAAHSMLSGSDWMIVKQTETSTGILPEWSEYRTEVRTEANRQCGQVDEATSVESLMAITASWPEDPDAVAERERRDAEIEAARLEREEND
tara:strand:+ start:139 stop:663 length:525 start_codon:yes stop_codon:yes gene_type:complete